MFVAICILLFGLYLVFILLSLIGWKKLRFINGKNHKELSFSIIVACKNEAHNMENLFSSLNQQNYPFANFEVIFVDDCSEDETYEIIKKLQKRSAFSSRAFTLEKSGGKKHALALGIENSGFDHILTSDADCELPKDLLQSYSDCFSSSKADLIAGPVRFQNSGSFFCMLQKLEFAVLSGISASFFGLDRPFMCNGANLGFTRELYTEMGGYSKHMDQLSGDDVFFLHQAKSMRKRMTFIKDPRAIVTTPPKTDLKAFIQQRIRWAGKSKEYSDKDSIAIALLIFAYNFALVLLSFLCIYNHSYIGLMLFLFVAKFILDLLFVCLIKKFYQLRYVFFNSIVLSLIYPFYTVAIGLISLIVPVKWK